MVMLLLQYSMGALQLFSCQVGPIQWHQHSWPDPMHRDRVQSISTKSCMGAYRLEIESLGMRQSACVPYNATLPIKRRGGHSLAHGIGRI